MKVLLKTLGLAALLLGLASCNGLGTSQPQASATPTAAPEATATPASDGQTSPLTLEIWLPPQFDPTAETEAAALLAARLADFSERHPGVRVSVRVKAETGPAGLLESLTAAAAAAPLALPDLIALPPAELDAAIGRNLLYPLDDYLADPDNSDWFPFAREFAEQNEQTYSLPFAADVLALAYRPGVLETPPASWAASLQLNGPLAFAAADPQALFPLALYLGRGGRLTDDSGRAILEQEQLRAVLAYFEQAGVSGLMPVWLTQYDQPAQGWSALLEGRATMAVIWLSTLLQSDSASLAAAPLATHNGQPFTLARGWAWALASPEPERHALAVELAEFLSAPEFLALWSTAAGVLPPRPGAILPGSSPGHTLAADLLPAAQLLPSPHLLERAGSPLREAALAVLKRELNPDAAAAQAVNAIRP